MFLEADGTVGAITTRAGDIRGNGNQDVLSKTRVSSERRLRKPKVQKSPFVRAGMEASQKSDPAVKPTQEEFTSNLKPVLASPEPWATIAGGYQVAPVQVR